jgi:hypothetical protein
LQRRKYRTSNPGTNNSTISSTDSQIIDLGIIINDHQAADSSKTSEIITTEIALIKEDGKTALQK